MQKSLKLPSFHAHTSLTTHQRRKAGLAAALAAFATLAVATAPAYAQADDEVRLVVRYKDGSTGTMAASRAAAQVQMSGQAVQSAHALPSGKSVVTLSKRMTPEHAKMLAAQLAADPSVASAELDVRIRSAQTNDRFYAAQWPLHPVMQRAGGANFAAAWQKATGANVTVAVLDSGINAHPDLQGQLVAGYDFVSDLAIAADGDGRDSDPTDPGDACPRWGSNSTWHGTKVSSQIVAVANNSYGLAGAAPSAKVMPVRVLGRCGGWLSDVSEALLWLAGQPVSGVPALASRPQIANLSLGGSGTCPQYMQEAITKAVAAGVTIVVASGNDGGVISTPANCNGTVSVGAHSASGDLTTYSNSGAQLTLTAPGGGQCRTQRGTACNTASTAVLSPTGATTATGWSEAEAAVGTSFAAPHVSAALALALSVKPDMSPSDLKNALVRSVRKHPAGTYCVTAGRCGAGMLDAQALVNAAADKAAPPPPLTVRHSSGVVARTINGQPVYLIARGARTSLTAAVGPTPGKRVTYAWKQIAGPAAVLRSRTDSARLDLQAPAASGEMRFEVVATVGGDVSVKREVALRVNNAPVLPKTPLNGAVYGGSWQIDLGAVDVDGDALQYVLNTPQRGLTLSSRGQLSWSMPPMAGRYTLQVQVSDAYGHVTKGSLVVNVAPRQTSAVSPVLNATTWRAQAGVPFSATVAATSRRQGAQFDVIGSSLPSGASVNGTTFQWRSPVAGSYRFTLTAVDDFGYFRSATFLLIVR